MAKSKNKKIILHIQNSNVGELHGDLSCLQELYKMFKIKHPNYFQILRNMRGGRNWDGHIKYITDSGKFNLGLLSLICQKIKDLGYKPYVVDDRKPIKVQPVIPKKVGKLTLRPEQKDALEKIISQQVGENNHPFYIGVADLSVNFGKSLIMAALYFAFKKNLKTILLTNDQDWLHQSKREFPDLIPSDELTFVQGSKVHGWKNFTIAMVQSLSRNIKTYQHELSQVQMVLIDEADQIDNKTYQNVIKHLYNTQVRIGLSGTIYLSKLKKDLVKNMNIRSFIGEKLVEFRLKDTIKKGTSTNVTIRIVEVDPIELVESDSYLEEYNRVMLDKRIIKLSLARTQRAIDKGRIPCLVVTKYINQTELLYKAYKKFFPDLKIAMVHNEIKDRKKIIEDFRDGKIDILIASTIIARGKNMPLIQYLQNMTAMKSNEKTIQILGRLVRLSSNKRRGYVDDFLFPGQYLRRHSKARVRYYQSEGLKVIKES